MIEPEYGLGKTSSIKVTFNNRNHHYPFSSHSWTVLSDNKCFKELDKSAFVHSGTGIPQELKPFFHIEDLRYGEKIFIKLILDDHQYEAYFTMDMEETRTRLFWRNSNFESILRTTWPDLYNAAVQDSFPNNTLPHLHFEAISEDRRTFKVTLVDTNNRSIRPLVLYEDYTRSEVHDIFDYNSKFTPQAGTWGLQGIIKLPNTYKSFVFFVTYGRVQGDHTFDEGIDENGILIWQSQPHQKLSTRQIRELISHDYLSDNIFLFLRTSDKRPYTYLGRVAYLTHDNELEQPVWFKWQILNWNLPNDKASSMSLTISSTINDDNSVPDIEQKDILIETPPPPKSSKQSEGQKTTKFRGRHVNFADADEKNRKLGIAGELLILDLEKQSLIKNGRPDLAQKVDHISQTQGDGAGYDILSYTVTGEPKYIEVKTTTGGANTPFIMTITEVAYSERYYANYYLARVYDYSWGTNSGKFYVEQGYVGKFFNMTAIQYRLVK